MFDFLRTIVTYLSNFMLFLNELSTIRSSTKITDMFLANNNLPCLAFQPIAYGYFKPYLTLKSNSTFNICGC